MIGLRRGLSMGIYIHICIEVRLAFLYGYWRFEIWYVGRRRGGGRCQCRTLNHLGLKRFVNTDDKSDEKSR